MIDWIRESYEHITAALVGGGMGRATWYAIRIQEGRRRFLDLFIIVDIIIAITMGLVGLGIGSYYDLSVPVLAAVSAVLGYLGPRGLEFTVLRFIARKGK